MPCALLLFAILPDIGGGELVVVLLLVLLLFGGEKMPQLAKGLGKALREFKKAAGDVEQEFKRAMDEVPDSGRDQTRRPDHASCHACKSHRSAAHPAQSVSPAAQHDDAPVPLPITGELDLHTFRPEDVDELIPAYLAECAARHLADVRIIHGKGTGRLRLKVHALLRQSPFVHAYRLGDERSGSWGATIVTLRR